MKNNNLITGLDIGSGAIRIAVGQTQEDGGLQIIGLSEGRSEGLAKGIITDIEDTVSSISSCWEQAEKSVGTILNHAFVGISGTHIISQESKGVIAISRADGEIKQADVDRVLEGAQTVATPPNYEILHIIPRSFTVDNQPDIKDPIGMTGVRLEVDAQIILGLGSQIKNLRKCLHRVGINEDELVFTPLATAEAVLNKRQKELGVAVVNIGSTTTCLTVFEEGDILTAKVLPIGSRHITSDVAIGLRISLDLAEAVKLNHGAAIFKPSHKNDTINLRELNSSEEGVISKKDLVEIIEARCEEIFKLIDKELMVIDRSAKLPAGVVLTGSGAKLAGLPELAKKVFRLPSSLGIPSGFNSVMQKAYDPSFATATGLLLWGSNIRPLLKRGIGEIKMGGFLGKIFKRFIP